MSAITESRASTSSRRVVRPRVTRSAPIPSSRPTPIASRTWESRTTPAEQALPAEALHLPFEAGPHRMTLGLVARRPGELIELDDRYPAEMAERRALSWRPSLVKE